MMSVSSTSRSRMGFREKHVYFFLGLTFGIAAVLSLNGWFFMMSFTPDKKADDDLILDLLENNASSTVLGHSSSFELANKESLVGFFKDIPELAWLLHKKRFQATQPNYDSSSKDFSAVTSSSLNLPALTR